MRASTGSAHARSTDCYLKRYSTNFDVRTASSAFFRAFSASLGVRSRMTIRSRPVSLWPSLFAQRERVIRMRQYCVRAGARQGLESTRERSCAGQW